MRNLLLLILLVSCENPLMNGAGVSSFPVGVVTESSSFKCNTTNMDGDLKFVSDKCSVKVLNQSGFTDSSSNGIILDIVMKPGDDGLCDGSLTNCSDLDESWTPEYSHLAGYWKLNGDVKDYSAHGNDSTKYGTMTDILAKVNHGFLMGTGSYTKNTAASALFDTISNNFSFSLWVHPTSSRNLTPETNSGISGTSGQSYAIFPTCGPGFNGSYASCIGLSVGVNGIAVYEHAAGHMPSPLTYDMAISDWTHIVVVYLNRTPYLYVNGVLVHTGVTSQRAVVVPTADLGDSSVLWNANYGAYRGGLDDYAVWDVSLDADEVAKLYARQSPAKSGNFKSRIMNAGADAQIWNQLKMVSDDDLTRIKFQARSCATFDCENVAWSESQVASALKNITVTDNRYFQYAVVMEGDTSLSDVTVLPIHYPSSLTTLTTKNPTPISKVNMFSANFACDLGMKFSVSSDNSSWLFWNGSNWVTSSDVEAETNTVVQINQGLATLNLSHLYVKGFMKTDATHGCELSELKLDGAK